MHDPEQRREPAGEHSRLLRYLARSQLLAVAPRALGAVIALFGCFELLTWHLGPGDPLPTVSGAASGATAFSFALLGVAIVLVASPRRGMNTAAAVLAGTVVALGAGMAVDALTSVAVPDATRPIEHPERVPGPVAPTTALSFCLLGIGLIVAVFPRQRIRWSGFAAPAVVLVLAFGILVGHLYEAPFLYLESLPVESVSATTAFVFMLAAFACLIARPNVVLTELLLQESMAGANYRMLFPASVLVPVAIGAAALVGHGDWYGVQGTVAITAVGSSVAIALLVTVTHLILSRSEVTLRLEDRALAAVNTGVVITNHKLPGEPIVWVNAGFTAIHRLYGGGGDGSQLSPAQCRRR